MPNKQQVHDSSVIQMISQHSSCDEDPMAESPYGEEEDEQVNLAASPLKSQIGNRQVK